MGSGLKKEKKIEKVLLNGLENQKKVVSNKNRKQLAEL